MWGSYIQFSVQSTFCNDQFMEIQYDISDIMLNNDFF